jgi:TIR domain-containing protein
VIQKSTPRKRARDRHPAPEKPPVFISHDSRDAALAHHFADLLAGATGGGLESFNSSDRRRMAGIEYGEEWYNTIIESLKAATDVVVLLTPHSMGRPWVLFEAGFAKGLATPHVFGVTLGIPLASAELGPFTQFQNFGDDEESLTDLVILLIRHNLHREPPKDYVQLAVREFRKKVYQEASLPRRAESHGNGHEITARIYEEVKLIARGMHRNSTAQLLGTRFHDEFPLFPDEQPGTCDAIRWMMFIGVLRDDLPWLYEIGLELYRALSAGAPQEIATAKEKMLRAVRLTAQNDWLLSVIAEGNRELAGRLLHLPELVETYLSQIAPVARKKGRARKSAL